MDKFVKMNERVNREMDKLNRYIDQYYQHELNVDLRQ